MFGMLFFLSIGTISFVKCFSFYHTGVEKKLLDCEVVGESHYPPHVLVCRKITWWRWKGNGCLVEITKGTLM